MKFFEDFALTNNEWIELEEEYGKLLNHQAWQLLKMNVKNNHTDEFEDISQEQRIAMYSAASYYKRQVYMEDCLQTSKEHVKDSLVIGIVEELDLLWTNRTRHGAGKVVFGDYQQELLEQIVRKYVPQEIRPNKKTPLNIDAKFITYCKAVTWNSKKSLGKKITREKTWRSGLVSFSSFDYLQAV